MCMVCFPCNMSKHHSKVPSLEDALKTGFSELKVGEANIKNPENETPVPSQEAVPAQQPILYNQKFEAVEDRAEFVVNTPVQSNQSTPKPPKDSSAGVEVVDEASSSIGDDFDVDW